MVSWGLLCPRRCRAQRPCFAGSSSQCPRVAGARHLDQRTHEAEEVAEAVEVVLRLAALVHLEVRAAARQKQRVQPGMAGRNALRSLHEVFGVGVRARQHHAAVHLGRVDGPVAEAEEGDRGVLEQRMEHLEWHRRAVFCQPDLVQHNRARKLGSVLASQELLRPIPRPLHVFG
eukprot:1343450-Rhodomonas_salina.2